MTCQPEIRNDVFLSTENLGSIAQVVIPKSRLTSRRRGGTEQFSVQMLSFTVTGGRDSDSSFGARNVPSDFKILYTLKPEN